MTQRKIVSSYIQNKHFNQAHKSFITTVTSNFSILYPSFPYTVLCLTLLPVINKSLFSSPRLHFTCHYGYRSLLEFLPLQRNSHMIGKNTKHSPYISHESFFQWLWYNIMKIFNFAHVRNGYFYFNKTMTMRYISYIQIQRLWCSIPVQSEKAHHEWWTHFDNGTYCTGIIWVYSLKLPHGVLFNKTNLKENFHSHFFETWISTQNSTLNWNIPIAKYIKGGNNGKSTEKRLLFLGSHPGAFAPCTFLQYSTYHMNLSLWCLFFKSFLWTALPFRLSW